MGSIIAESKLTKEAEAIEAAKAQVDIWQYIFGFTPMAVLKCAIELEIADVIESHGGSMTLPDLSSSLNCSQSYLHRIMRYLIHRGIFKQISQDQSSICYIQTALSRLLMKNTANSLAALVLLESSPVMLAPWHRLSARALNNGGSAFEAAHGEDVWEYALKTLDIGIGSVVDVGGGDGTSLRSLVKGCPWIRGINFDLSYVVSVAPKCDGIEYVDGNMFESVPKADAAFLMWVLHDWSDEECIQILKNCREAIPKDTGKVIIAEAVIDEGGDEDKYSDVRLALDMVMLAHTEKGKERTVKEWEYVLNEAGFTSFSVKHIQSIISVIEAYP
ncbi:hypothetical protein BUALT_Bualt19G0128900 [Buddleja alternifolia]|uniref:O-methyltransferase n=1 Tax=Buddleja alternifolia TaxID=168488 RepID=A0AAV6W2P0_9LAMI|nr:hypothetical protein BUALT_Bualt19G0128900 [Buddleja alternifolia]